jgi:hypothetical protein
MQISNRAFVGAATNQNSLDAMKNMGLPLPAGRASTKP